MTYEPDLAIFEREVHRRAALGEGTERLAKEFSVPAYVVERANVLGDSSLIISAESDGAYQDRLLALARRRPGLFFPVGFAPEVPVEFADGPAASAADTDDIGDPFGPQDSNGGYLGGIA